MEGRDFSKLPRGYAVIVYAVGVIAIMLLALLFSFLASSSAKAFEPDGNSYSRTQYEARQRTLRKVVRHNPEPITTVERHVLSREDYEADPSILISAEPRKPNVVYVDRVVYVERKPMVATISAEWEE